MNESEQNQTLKEQKILLNQEIHRQSSSMYKKRQNFHKQIRREKLNQIFKQKRALLIQNLNQMQNSSNLSAQKDIRKKCLFDCLANIKKSQKIEENLIITINILALQKPFQRLFVNERNQFKQGTIEQIEQYCYNLVDIVLYQTIPKFSNDSKKRQYCFNALSNLFADSMCHNVRFVKPVVDCICTYFGSVDLWEMDDEMVQVYYMLGNLMNKKIIHAQMLYVQKLLEWCQNSISCLSSHPLQLIVKGLIKLFADVDQAYNKDKNLYLVDQYRFNREIIIQNLIKRLIQTANGDNLTKKGSLSLDPQNIKTFFNFFSKNKSYLLKCFSEWQQDEQNKKYLKMFIYKILHLLNQQQLSKSVVKEIGSFFLSLLKIYHQDHKNTQNLNQQMQMADRNQVELKRQELIKKLNDSILDFHRFILSNSIDKLLRTICYYDIDLKLISLKVLVELLQNLEISYNIQSGQKIQKCLDYLLKDCELQNIIINLVRDSYGRIRNIQILNQLISLYKIIIIGGNGKLGHRIKQIFRQALNNYNSLPQEIYSIIQELIQLHRQKQSKVL